MNFKLLIYTLSISIFSSASYAQRDPFSPVAGSDDMITQSLSRHDSLFKTATIIRKGGIARVLIGTRLYENGESVEGYRLVDIKDDVITLKSKRNKIIKVYRTMVNKDRKADCSSIKKVTVGSTIANRADVVGSICINNVKKVTNEKK
jgi:hypothetical protein